MYKLYYAPGRASLAVHLTARELGLDCQLVLVDIDAGENKESAYLSLNPAGKVPTLVCEDGRTLTESAAICLFLAQQHASGSLYLSPDSSEHQAVLQWLFHFASELQPLLLTYHYPQRYAAEPARHESVRRAAEDEATRLFERIDTVLARSHWLVGKRLSVADIYLFMLARWARHFSTPPRSLPRLGTYLDLMARRPAFVHVFAVEKLEAPIVWGAETLDR